MGRYVTSERKLRIYRPNPDLTWQTTKKLNVGITSSFFDERLNVNFDYYNEYTDDMLIDISLPPSSGASTVKDNYGAQESNGIEFAVWGKPIVTKDFSWTVSVNGLHSKTVIKNISEALQRKKYTLRKMEPTLIHMT